MSKYKIAGCCTCCDKKIFDVKAVFEQHHPRAGEPKELGRAHPEAWRVTFGLYDGSTADFSFCAECAEKLTFEMYIAIWQKALRSFMREGAHQNPEHRKWFMPMLANGILLELNRILLRDLEAK